MKKVLILSVSAGAGHVRAAEALRVAAQGAGLSAEHLDVMDVSTRLFRKLYCESYIKIVERSPELWEFLYHKTDKVQDKRSASVLMRSALQQLNTKEFASAVREREPDVVICTHFLPAELLSGLIRKGKFSTPCWVQVTDFDVHSLWVHPGMTGYCVASDEIAWRLAAKGVLREHIRVTGIPVMPGFGKTHPRVECARELGIDPAKKTILLMSGGMGVGDIASMAKRLLALGRDLQIVALAGKNARLLSSLKSLAAEYPGRLFPQGFSTTVERIMAACDIAVSKPGGLTASECLAIGLPMVVISPIPGQEERNSDYLLENGAAMKAHDLAGLEYKILTLLDNPQLLKQMAARSAALGRPSAAAAALKAALS